MDATISKEIVDQKSDHLLSRAEAQEYGRSLRDKVPRTSHAQWKASSDRQDPVDILIESSQGREAHLVPIRYGCMLKSPFAFSTCFKKRFFASSLLAIPITSAIVIREYQTSSGLICANSAVCS